MSLNDNDFRYLAEAVVGGTRKEFMELLTTVPLLIIETCPSLERVLHTVTRREKKARV